MAQHAVAPIEGTQARKYDKSDGYYNLLSYIVSNAISGEIMAVENYSEMVLLMPEPEQRIEANQQAWEECVHIQQLSKLAKSLGFSVAQRIVEPQWQTIRDHFSAAVRKGNLPACLIIQDVMTETMAIVLYRILEGEADTDKQTAAVARRILKDELKHLEMGRTRLKALREENPQEVDDALIWAHHRVMPELFSMISTSCHSLCDVLSLDCGSLSLDDMDLDLESIRVSALNQYIESLDSIGFEPKVINPLVASMAAYGGMEQIHIAGDSSTPCCGIG